jgi:hypothetical protein
MNTTPKPRPCAHCKREFLPARPMQAVCSQRCATRKVKADRDNKVKEERAKTRAQREALKTRGRLQAEAQEAFNAYIRYRDMGLPYIDCGQPFEPGRPGGSVDAGNYLARSVAPNLRFHEDNVHAQRKNCNRPGGTTRADFRAGLVARIGEERVQALEADHTPRKYTQDDFRSVRDTYRAKLKELKEKT